MRRLVSVLLAAFVGAGLLLGTVSPASAALAPTSSVISPGTESQPGTSYVPPSVIRTTGGVPDVTNQHMPGLLWSAAGNVAQSIRDAGFDLLTAITGRARTATGFGFSKPGRVLCRGEFTLAAGGGWPGKSVPINRVSIVHETDPRFGITPAYCASGSVVARVTCYGSAGGGFTSGSWSVVEGTQPAGSDACQGLGTPISAVIEPSDENAAHMGYDGGSWVNPAYQQLVRDGLVVSVAKTCKNPANGATTVVTADGAAGSGVAPSVGCPAGTYPVSMRTWSHMAGAPSAFVQELGTTALASGAETAYGDCLAGGCDLWIGIDGVRCALLLKDCDRWLDRVNGAASPADSGVTCNWGTHAMGLADCGALRDCYRAPLVPVDAISNPASAGAATACGINPGSGPGSLPEPIYPNNPGNPWVPPELPPATFPPTPGPSGSAGNPGSDGDDGDDGQDGEDGEDGQDGAPGGTPTVNVTVSPTIIVNVPTPQVTVNVNVPAPGPVSIPAGSSGSSCFSGDDGGAGGKAGLLALAKAKGIQATEHLDPEGQPSFDLFASGSANTALAEELRVNHARYGLKYVISQMRIASERSGWAWRDYTPIQSTGDFRHDIHVHVTYGNSTTASEVTWNPVDWAYKPIKCVVDGALQPTPGKVGETGKAMGDALGAPLKEWQTAMAGYASAFTVTNTGGCEGPPLKLGHPLNMTIYPASACEYPKSTLARISTFGVGALLIGSGLWSCVRLLAGGFGFTITNGQGD